MFTVEMYVRVRRACMVEGMSVREASPGVRSASGHGAQDAGLLGSARLPANEPATPTVNRQELCTSKRRNRREL